jgi:hypothetical protein
MEKWDKTTSAESEYDCQKGALPASQLRWPAESHWGYAIYQGPWQGENMLLGVAAVQGPWEIDREVDLSGKKIDAT